MRCSKRVPLILSVLALPLILSGIADAGGKKNAKNKDVDTVAFEPELWQLRAHGHHHLYAHHSDKHKQSNSKSKKNRLRSKKSNKKRHINKPKGRILAVKAINDDSIEPELWQLRAYGHHNRPHSHRQHHHKSKSVKKKKQAIKKLKAKAKKKKISKRAVPFFLQDKLIPKQKPLGKQFAAANDDGETIIDIAHGHKHKKSKHKDHEEEEHEKYDDENEDFEESKGDDKGGEGKKDGGKKGDKKGGGGKDANDNKKGGEKNDKGGGKKKEGGYKNDNEDDEAEDIANGKDDKKEGKETGGKDGAKAPGKDNGADKGTQKGNDNDVKAPNGGKDAQPKDGKPAQPAKPPAAPNGNKPVTPPIAAKPVAKPVAKPAPIVPIQAMGEYVTKCNTPGQVALTFAEGPSEATTQMLEILREAKARVTFFANATWLEYMQYAGVTRKAYNDGHLIGMTYRLPNDSSKTMTEAQMKADIAKAATAIHNLIGMYPKYIRLHEGSVKDPKLEPLLRQMGYMLVGFNLDEADYKYTSREQASQIANIYETTFNKQAEAFGRKGSYVAVGYDIPASGAAAALPDVIQSIIRNEYDMVRIDGCVNDTMPYKKSPTNNDGFVGDDYSFGGPKYVHGQSPVALQNGHAVPGKMPTKNTNGKPSAVSDAHHTFTLGFASMIVAPMVTLLYMAGF
ncbi:chitin deacetylase [Actinomortierella wolfii]|nr:chitin deacetylase [Actinomortierella wolfii]